MTAFLTIEHGSDAYVHRFGSKQVEKPTCVASEMELYRVILGQENAL